MNLDGTRNGNVELSSIDTAILVIGALTAGEYFGGDVKNESQKLYESVEWDKFIYTKDRWLGYNYPMYDNQFFSAWKPGTDTEYETGPYLDEEGDGRFSNRFWNNSDEPFTWDYYTDEVMLINLLVLLRQQV